jgi:hypothetical protein
MPLAQRLYQDALRAGLPEFTARTLIHQAEAGDRANPRLARTLTASIDNPALRARAAALDRPRLTLASQRRRTSTSITCHRTDQTSR